MSLSGTIRAGAAYVEVTAQTSKLQRGLANAQAQLQQFGRSCTAIGKDMLMLSGAFAVPMAMAVKGFAEFDDQMRLVKAVTKSTKAEFESLTKVAAKLGRETSFTAKQVADGMVSLGRMGFSPKEIEQAIQPTLDLARATGTDLGEAANIAANSMRIFGIEASRMSDVADILTATANGSAQTLTDLFEALKMAGPQAKAAGENITDTSVAIGVLANLGIKGSLAGTALRKSFSQFAKTKVQDKLKAVGISTVNANGNLCKMPDGSAVFSGKPLLMRKPEDVLAPVGIDFPHEEIYALNFSEFRIPGSYYIEVHGYGNSELFRIGGKMPIEIYPLPSLKTFEEQSHILDSDMKPVIQDSFLHTPLRWPVETCP